MVEKKNGGNGDVDVIERGYVFNENNGSWEALPEGYGVIVVHSNGKVVAYGRAWDAKDDLGIDSLAKNLAGAKFQHGGQAFLIKRENGIILIKSEKLPPEEVNRK